MKAETIYTFENELRKRVQARDKDANVMVYATPATQITGEYVAVIEPSKGSKEVYAFNPKTREWIVCYSV